MSIRSFLLIFFVVLFDNLLYCQGTAYKSQPLPTNAELSGGLSGLKPVDPQSVAYGLAGGDPIKLQRLAVLQGLLIRIDLFLGGFITIFVVCLVLLVRNKTGYQFLASRSGQRGHGEEIIIETTIVPLAVTGAPSTARNSASQSHAWYRRRRPSIFLRHASVKSIRWPLKF